MFQGRKLKRSKGFGAIMVAAAMLLASCGSGKDADSRANRGPAAVSYVVVQPSSVPLVKELPGRVSAYEVSQVRPQVSGIIQRRYFSEGSIVHKGQTLYQIDPSQYQAAAAQAAANLQSARANADAANGKKVFASAGCGGCHTFSKAGSSGSVGPNLDDASPSFETVVTQVTNGGGAMPAFKDRLSEQEIRDVAAFVSGQSS